MEAPPIPTATAEPASTTRPATDTSFTRRPFVLFLLAAAAAIAAGTTIGTTIGLGVSAASGSSCTPTDGWCELGAAVLGLFAGFVSGVIAYAVTGIVVIRRRRPSGHRARHIAAHLASPPAAMLTLAVLGELIAELS